MCVRKAGKEVFTAVKVKSAEHSRISKSQRVCGRVGVKVVRVLIVGVGNYQNGSLVKIIGCVCKSIDQCCSQ